MIAEGHDVRILSRATSNLAILEGLPVEKVIGDVTDPESVRRAVQGQDWVVHAAASLEGDHQYQMRVNVEGTRHVAQACRIEGVRRMVHISSVAAVGIPTDLRQPANEESPFNLEDSGLTYHLSKRRAEEEIMAEVRNGLNAIIVNPASVKGPHGARYRGAEIVQTVRRAFLVPYFTGGICVVHVQDVVAGILSAFKEGEVGHRYILGGENLTFLALGKTVAGTLGLKRRFVPLSPVLTGFSAMILEPWGRLRNRQPWMTYAVHYCANRNQFYDSSKARKALGYAPRDFKAILDECVDFLNGVHAR